MKTRDMFRVFIRLLWRDIYVLRKTFVGRMIDALIWSGTSIIISGFILPAFGITQRFGLLIWIGSIITMGLFEAVYEAQDLVADREGNFHTGYLVTLPVPVFLVFIKIACSIALNSLFLSLCMFPLGPLLLGNMIDLSHFSFIKSAFVMLLINLFFGFFALWIFSWAKNPTRFSTVRRRIVQPIWLFGGYQFTWFVFYKTFPRLAIINLLNPVTYAFEGLRAAVFGPADFIPFWISCCALIGFTGIGALWSTVWLKRRLDCV